MTLARIIVALTALVFIGYGAAFVVAPAQLSQWVTGTTSLTTSALIDMRATYGGMSIAVGVLLLLLSRSDPRPGLVGVLVAMLCMAVTRTWGILIDGAGNNFMYVYLVLELVVALTAGALIAWSGRNSP